MTTAIVALRSPCRVGGNSGIPGLVTDGEVVTVTVSVVVWMTVVGMVFVAVVGAVTVVDHVTVGGDRVVVVGSVVVIV